MTRQAVGATVAALVLFSSVLVSNFSVLAGAQEEAALAAARDAESSLASSALLLRGEVALVVLGDLQSRMAQGLPCNSPAGAIAGGSYGPEEMTSGNMTAMATGRLADSAPQDNLSVIGPFAGLVQGGLGLRVSTLVDGRSDVGAVTFDKTEVHFVGIPADVSGAGAVCVAVLAAAAGAVATLGPGMCNSSGLASIIEPISDRAEEPAPGLTGSLSYSIHTAPSCSVDLSLTVYIVNVQGPNGLFTVPLRADETLSPEAALPGQPSAP